MVPGIVSFLIFLLALNGMVFVHEFGHYLAARWAGIEVEEFGFGLPSYKLASLFTWRGTEFTIHALPLGGFIRPKGENDPNVPGGLAAANPWKRIIVLAAGPFMNLLTAVVVFTMYVAAQGKPIPGPVHIESVTENSPAEQANIQPGDLILAINGEKVSDIDVTISTVRDNLDKPIELLIERDGKEITITATPLSSRNASEGALGVALSPSTQPATFRESINKGVGTTLIISTGIFLLPVSLVQGVISPEQARFNGLFYIYRTVDAAVEADVTTRQEVAAAPSSSGARPTNWTLYIIGLLSVSLGVFNLFPIPALDGGRILFTLPEILFKKRIPMEMENMVNGVAMLLLIGLMIFVNVMDFVDPGQVLIP